jgi:hypothetical protein
VIVLSVNNLWNPNKTDYFELHFERGLLLELINVRHFGEVGPSQGDDRRSRIVRQGNIDTTLAMPIRKLGCPNRH